MTATLNNTNTNTNNTTPNARRARRIGHLPGGPARRKGGSTTPVDQSEKCPDCNDAEQRAQRILDEVREQSSERLGYVLRGLQMLAESQRVLKELDIAAGTDKALAERIRSCVYEWREPITLGERHGYSVFANLTRVAVLMNDELVDDATAEVDRRAQREADSST